MGKGVFCSQRPDEGTHGLQTRAIGVFNHLGILVHSEYMESKQLEKTLRLDALPAGLYFIQVCDAAQTIIAQTSILKN